MLGNDRFVIERRLGEGSMGAVYLAYDRTLRGRVALKTLRRVDASGIYLFKREFRALVDLVHPNLVRLHELFSQGDEWFFTMEYVRGRSFLDYVISGTLHPNGPLALPTGTVPADLSGSTQTTDEHLLDGLEMLFPTPIHSEERLRDVMQQITEGVIAVHNAGKLHRDLKPDNVMVTEEGRAVVLDFGVVIERSHDPLGTVEPTVFGTPAYMSPEQAAGRPIDVASDWYAMGVMLFEALTGGLPFDGSYHDVLRNKQDCEPPRPSHMVSGVSPELDNLCVKLLAREPNERPTGKHILEALRPRNPVLTVYGKPQAHANTAPDFVGRENELSQLRAALQATDAGVPVTCFVSGTSGIGKTTVVERFLQLSHHTQDAVVLRGRCYERESVPFKAVDSLIDSLCRYLRRLSPQQAAELLPRDIHPLCQLFPVLTRVEAFANPPGRLRHFLEPQQMRRRAFSALRELLARVADRHRLVLFIDDLQWGDLDSAFLLREVLADANAPALLLVCAYREDEQPSPCVQSLRRYIEDALVDLRPIAVGPLSDDESCQLLRALRAEQGLQGDTVSSPHHDAGGNPYLLSELVQYAADRPGAQLPTYSNMVEARIQNLSEQAQTLLHLVSVAGRPVTEEVLSLSTTFDIDMQESLLALRSEKLVRGVALRNGRAVEVYHNRIREVVLSSIGTEGLRRWNRRLATTLEATGSLDLEALVAHLLAAGDGARAGLYALRAAEQAAAALAFDKAARLYAIAAAHAVLGRAERHELLMSWAETMESAGRGAEAGALYLEASKTSAPTEAALLRQQAGVQLLSVGELQRGTGVLRDALRRVGMELSLTPDAAMERTALLRSELLHGELLHGDGVAEFAHEDTLPAELRQRLDLIWAVAHALLLHDTVRAIPLLHQFAVEAIAAGERHRIVKGLAYCDVMAELILPQWEGGTAVDGLAVAEALLDSDAPKDVAGCVLFARGMRLLNSDAAQAGLAKLRAADKSFSSPGAALAPEGRLCRVALLGVENITGHDGDPSQSGRFEREAEAAGDHLMGAKLRLLSGFSALRRDTPDYVRTLCNRADFPATDNDEIGLVSEWLIASALALYEADILSCQTQLSRYAELSTSLLLSIRVFSAHTFSMLARLHLFVSQMPETETTEIGAAARTLRQAEDMEVRSLGPLLLVARAALERQRGNMDTAGRLLRRAADGSEDIVQGVAQYVLHCMSPAASGLAIASRSALRERGVDNPEAFARLFFPLLHEGSLKGT